VDEEGMRQLIEVCLEMMNKLCSENKVKQVRAQVKLLPCAQINSVADKAEEYQASWVILDRYKLFLPSTFYLPAYDAFTVL